MSKIKLFVGLGNPGAEYQYTRHNIGFLWVDAMHDHLKANNFTNKFHGQFAATDYANQKILFLKPQTYMNRSGISVLECANFYKISLNDIIIIHDDLDLEFGRIRIKSGGGSGGHNGLKSLDQMITPQYYRLRFGIGKPPYKNMTSDYVLTSFSLHEKEKLGTIFTWMTNNIKDLINLNIEHFLNSYALFNNKEKQDGI